MTIIILVFIIIITTCLQTSRGASVWSNCSRVQEAHEPTAKAEEDGLGLPGHGRHDEDDDQDDHVHNDDDDDEEEEEDDDDGDGDGDDGCQQSGAGLLVM